MKLSRINLALALILLALVALDGITWPRAQDAREVLPLFEPWAPGQVTTIRVEQGEQGNYASDPDLLVQLDGAGVYRLPDHFGYRARERAVMFLINGIASLNSMDLLSEDAASHATYGLTDAKAARVRLQDADGTILADLLQGDKAPGGRAFYVRRSDSDQVYRAPNFIRQPIRGNLLTWIESRWCTMDMDLLRSIEISGSAGGAPVVLTREKGSRQVWKDAAGEPVAGSQVQLFLRAVGLVTIKGVVGEGSVQPQAGQAPFHIRLTHVGGVSWQGRVGLAQEGQDREGSIQLSAPTSDDPSATRSYRLLLSPAASATVQNRLEKLLE